MTEKNTELNAVEKYLIEAIKDIQFGSVEVTIHNSQVVQIEKSEKRRFEAGKQAV